MADIQEKIGALCPQAQFETVDDMLLITVADENWHPLAKALKEELHYDYLTAIVGMDWKDSLGCIYYLTNTATQEMLHVKVATTDRENPRLHTVSDLWAVANYQEREVYDFFGIVFINHPDMRRFFLRNDWVGYPLRKDYDDSPELNPLRLNPEENEDDTFSLVEEADGTLKRIDKKVFGPEEYVINVGPQHPSTHGVMRYRASIEGELVKKIDVVSGYIHRGIEKLCEGMPYLSTLLYPERLDYMAAHMNRHAVCLCIEKALGIEVPHRAELIRMMMDELMRLSSHLLSYGCLTMDQGATTAFFYGFRERELIYDIFDKTCGARMSMSYSTIGGVVKDVHPDFIKDVRHLCAVMPEKLKEYHKLFTGNVIAVGRMKGVGILSKEDAINYAITGPSGRASGVHCDVRKCHPYSLYNEVEFDEVLLESGDSMDRYMVRMKEMEQSVKILEQCCDMLEKEGIEGEYCAKVPKMIKLPAGHWYQQVEASRGAFGVYIESDGDAKPFQKPYRMHFQSPCFNLVGVVDLTCKDNLFADLISITASIDYVIPDIDR
ncbi:MAG: NADH-quinone oxidoreductase subunit D [Muribaculaceae bacterium]|jgi:NADH-quinone oxidoreductase subunit C/D|nr:NADH-quinone oxidoreductase subunit D [Muribaculaceae bacterium]MBQ2491053.1 NADH-quinone oxidoreductase subunit D [Muribaculaceae bacterium]